MVAEKKELERREKISETMSTMTEEKVRKIREAFALGCSVGEVLYYADIPKSTYYDWIRENPNLSDEIERLKEKPILMARQAVVSGLTNDKHFAFRFLERKLPKEFADKTSVQLVQQSASLNTTNVYMSPGMQEMRKKHLEDFKGTMAKMWDDPEFNPELKEVKSTQNETESTQINESN